MHSNIQTINLKFLEIKNKKDSIDSIKINLAEARKKTMEFKTEGLFGESQKQTLLLKSNSFSKDIEELENIVDNLIKEAIFYINESVENLIKIQDFYEKTYYASKVRNCLDLWEVNTNLGKSIEEKKFINEFLKKIDNLINEPKSSQNQSHKYFIELIMFDYEKFVSKIQNENKDLSSDEKNPKDFIDDLRGLLDIFNKKYELFKSGNINNKKELVKTLKSIYDPLHLKATSKYLEVTKKNHKVSMPSTYSRPIGWAITCVFLSIYAIAYKNIFIILIFIAMIGMFIKVLFDNSKLIEMVKNQTFNQRVNKDINEIIDILNKNYNNKINILEKSNLEINKMNDKIDFVSKDCPLISNYFPNKFKNIV